MPRTLRELDRAVGPIAYGAACGDEYLKCPVQTQDTPCYCDHCGQWVDSLPCHACFCLACKKALDKQRAIVAASAERETERIIADLERQEQDRAIADLVALGTKLYLRLYMADYSATELELIKNWLNERE